VFPLSESPGFRADFPPYKAAIRRNTGGISRIDNAVWRKIRRKTGDERLWEHALVRGEKDDEKQTYLRYTAGYGAAGGIAHRMRQRETGEALLKQYSGVMEGV